MDPLFAQAFGANDSTVAWQRVWGAARVLLIVCLPIGVMHAFAPVALRLLQQDAAVIPLGGQYSQINILGIVPFAGFALWRQFLQGDAQMWPVASAILLGNIVNVFLNLGFVYGFFGLPHLGAIGTAWATVVSMGHVHCAAVDERKMIRGSPWRAGLRTHSNA